MKFERGTIPFFEPGKPPRSDLLAEIDFLDQLELVWGRKWGAQGLGRPKYALVSRPTENEVFPESLKEPAYYFHHATVPRLEDLQEQWDNLMKVLKDEGVELAFLEPPKIAMGPYTRLRAFWGMAWIFVVNGGAIIPKFCLSAYNIGIEPYYTRRLAELGCPILYTIHGKGALEVGANTIWLDAEHLVIGIGSTGNIDGVEQIRPILERAGIKDIHVTYTPGWLDSAEWPSGMYGMHLDMYFTTVDVGLAVAFAPFLNYHTIAYLRKKKIRLIEVPPEEARITACNTLAIEPGKVVMVANCPKTAGALRREGVDVIEVDMSAFLGKGGPHCAVGALIREGCPSIEEL